VINRFHVIIHQQKPLKVIFKNFRRLSKAKKFASKYVNNSGTAVMIEWRYQDKLETASSIIYHVVS